MEADDINREGDGVRIYELGYHIISSVPEEKVAGQVTVIKDLIAKEGGVVVSEEFPKLKRLAYIIKKSVAGRYERYDSAYFGWVKFELSPAKIALVKKAIDADPSVLRFLLIETVRGSTLAVIRPPSYRVGTGRIPRKDPETKTIPATPISEAELDKTIDALVSETSVEGVAVK